MGNRFTTKFEKADKAFDGIYQDELNQLMGLSKDQIDRIIPDTTDLRVYSVLIDVVKEASEKNLSQAELLGNIRELGDVAVTLAKKVPKFAALL
ncbi:MULTISPECIES: hypothetical protein [Zunongwangia]|uniref:Uncharacterized protein n=1 Tax=Zunongwangia atlantica 22II14-10F7 TaxID=1185767 RepID=A0A1Y1T5M8_9FLAO|nr:hypothetical protein [Zunongwangia atlantica]ORL46340.1 hypothetical protein IIF7_07211 [Zunongwangia atlantica 22II14-10F7]